MELGIALPQQYADGAFEAEGFRRYLARAEALGFHSAWTGEQVLGTAPLFEPLAMLAAAAVSSTRIRLGCAMFISPLRNPVLLAKQLSTVDQLCGGRLEVGIAAGGPFRPFSAFDADPGTYLARFAEGVALMKALWQEPRVTVAGRFWQLEGAAMEPKPHQRPGPPVWVGGSHPAAVRRAVRLGDGFMGAGSCTTEQFAQQVLVARAALAEAGRDPSNFRVGKRIYVAVDDDPERARCRIEGALDRLYGYFGLPHLAAVAVAGTPSQCAQGVRRAVDAGAQLVLLDPLTEEPDQMERLAAEVVPDLA